MRHFFRTHVRPANVMTAADAFFVGLGMTVTQSSARERTYQGVIGTPEVVANLRLVVKPDGGHSTFVEGVSDQMGESRLDRNIKRFFVELRNAEDPRHRIEAAY
jgi:hypothetical protein